MKLLACINTEGNTGRINLVVMKKLGKKYSNFYSILNIYCINKVPLLLFAVTIVWDPLIILPTKRICQ